MANQKETVVEQKKIETPPQKHIRQKLAEIQQKLKAPKSQHNNFGNYDYRNAEDILEAVKPLLGDCTVTFEDSIVHFQSSYAPQVITITDVKGKTTQEVVGGDRFYVQAVAVFSDGVDEIRTPALAREEDTKKGMDAAQITGAASSYARKYALNSLFAIDDTKDADSQDNSKTQTKKEVIKTSQTVPPQKIDTPQAEVNPATDMEIQAVIMGINKLTTEMDLLQEQKRIIQNQSYTNQQKYQLRKLIDAHIKDLKK